MFGGYIVPDRVVPDIGDKIDEYTIQQRLGEGSFGSVFKVLNKNNQVFALKLLNLYAIPGQDIRIKIMHRFNLEYQTGLIQSKYLVQAKSYGIIKGNPYIIMDFCENGDLRKHIDARIPVNFAIQIATNILLGLKALHREGKVHRDLKPENILLTKGNIACLTDFGISGHKDMRLTKKVFGKPNEIFGTYAYMPPEQLKPPNVNVTILPTTDIFSFGVTMFELFTAKLPFGSLQHEYDIPEYVRRVNKGQWTNIKSLRQDVPNNWVGIIEMCLAPKYKDRYQNVDEILELIGKIDYTPPKKYNSVKNQLGLQIMQGEDHGKIYNLSDILDDDDDDGLITIGREDDDVENDIEVMEEMTSYISREHATIEKLSEPKGWYIRDGQFIKNRWKKSTNGTYVNSKEVGMEHFLIKPDDIITIGDTTLKVIII